MCCGSLKDYNFVWKEKKEGEKEQRRENEEQERYLGLSDREKVLIILLPGIRTI